MKSYDVVRLGLILAAQVEVEGMKAENKLREYQETPKYYNEEDFQKKRQIK